MNQIFEKSLYALFAIVIVSCATVAPMLPSEGDLQWTTFHSDRMGFTIDIPSDFLVQEYDGDIFFRYKEHMALRITLATPEVARAHGLWPISPPVGDVNMAGKGAKEYIYDHHDGPIYDHFVAFVVDHRGQSLALAFHTDQNELNSAQQRILDSLKLD